jgi:hypothetical protein
MAPSGSQFFEAPGREEARLQALALVRCLLKLRRMRPRVFTLVATGFCLLLPLACTGGDGLKGSTGTGGATGTGGVTGSGGATGITLDGGESCDQIAADYTTALGAAVACTPGAPNQCQALVATVPTSCPDLACGNQVFVNDGTGLETVRDHWLNACDPEPLHSCPAIACASPAPPSVCVANAPNATSGICVPSLAEDAGTSGTGGTTGTGGSSGTGGTGGTGGESCDQLSIDYTTALTAALVCTPGAPNQCQMLVSSVPSGCPLTGCGPEIYVNDTTAVAAAQSTWVRQCVGPVIACPQIACRIAISPSVCVPNDGGASAGASADASSGASAGTCVQAVPIEL